MVLQYEEYVENSTIFVLYILLPLNEVLRRRPYSPMRNLWLSITFEIVLFPTTYSVQINTTVIIIFLARLLNS